MLLLPWTASIPYISGIPNRDSRADFWNPSTISAQSDDSAFSKGALPPELRILPSKIKDGNIKSRKESNILNSNHNLWGLKFQLEKSRENGTDRVVSNGGRGCNSTLDLDHLTNLLLQRHSRKKILHTSFDGFIGILVNAIHVTQFAHLLHLLEGSRRRRMKHSDQRHKAYLEVEGVDIWHVDENRATSIPCLL